MTPQKARDYFFHLHDVECNQKYNKTLPYSFHLEMVEKQALKFKHLVPYGKANPANIYSDVTLWDAVIVGVYGHDSIEDARLTYNDIVSKFGNLEAEIIYLCTEWHGRTRAERHCAGYWKALGEDELAVFVKLCDVIANVKFSLLTNSSMFSKYKEEYRGWRQFVYKERYKEMFDYLESLFTIK